MSALLPLVLVGPLVGAAAAVSIRHLAVRRVIGLATAASVLAVAVTLVTAARDGDVLAAQVGGWPPGVSITFAADLFSALMLALTSLLVVASLCFAAATGDDEDRFFVPLALVLSAGVFGALLTADLFNLFVCIEMALIPSYVLMTRTGTAGILAAGRLYIVVNLLGSTIYLVGVALVYGTTGTVNLGQLAGAARSDQLILAMAVILVALAVKAALVPVHGWLPRTYPAPSPAVTVLLSGLLTKVGVYAVFRIYSVVFDGRDQWSVLVLVAVASMVVGVLGALGETTMREVLAFHMVSQVGYILLGLAIGTVAGVAAGIFYLLTYTVVKTSLFLSAGAVGTIEGTDRLDRLGGLARRYPLLAIAFLGAALSLIGVPPLVGFVAKFALVRAGFGAGQYVPVAFAVVVSFFTLLSMLKIWNGVFWGDLPAGQVEQPARIVEHLGLVLPGLVLAVLALLVGLAPQVLLALAEQAALGLLDPTAYVTSVTGG